MKQLIRISAQYDGKDTAEEQDAALEIQLVTEQSQPDAVEYHAVVTNRSAQPVFLETVRLLDCSPSDFPLQEGPYDIYRSGRHKNDMPGMFTTGCPDARMQDVSAVMAESGDRMESAAGNRIISDHLTLLKDRNHNVLAIEFLTGRDQLFQTVLDLDEYGNLCRLTSETIFQIILPPNETVTSETIRLARTTDPDAEVQVFAKRKAALYGSRNQRHPAVFCTWYYYGLTVTYEDVKTCLHELQKRQLPYDVFQVDEGWEVTLGEYEPNHKFPVSMRQIAEEIREAGYIPGIWSSPFVAHETAGVWKQHPEWILKDRDGNPCLFPMNDTVYYVFDITNPDTYVYFTELYRKFTFDWGYPYHKLDFTRAAVIYEHADYCDKTIPIAKAYYRAVQAVRSGMGEKAFLLMCGGLYDPIIGLVDAQRTGSDVLSMWSSTISKGGKTAPYTIRQSILRSYMNEWWANDPDALMIRENHVMERDLRLTLGLLNEEEVKTSLINQFAGGGIMCQTEPLDQISEKRLNEIRHLLPVLETTGRPLHLMAPERFPSEVDVLIRRTGVHCICRINWSDTKPEPVILNLSDLHLPSGKYAVCDFYAGIYMLNVSEKDRVTLGTLQPHGATVIKAELLADQPVIVQSDGHYAMGAECETLKIENGILHVKPANPLHTDLHYKIWLPEPWLYQGSRIADIVCTAAVQEITCPLEQTAQ